MSDISLELFKFPIDQSELIQAYFSHLTFVYTEIINEFKTTRRDINDPCNHVTEKYDLKKLVEHFENAIKMNGSAQTFRHIIQKLAEKEPLWNFIENELKLKQVTNVNCLLDGLDLIED
jgi:hypothetical protein